MSSPMRVIELHATNWTGSVVVGKERTSKYKSDYFGYTIKTTSKPYKYIIYSIENCKWDQLELYLLSYTRLSLSDKFLIICISKLIGHEYGCLCHNDEDCTSIFINQYSMQCKQDSIKKINIIKLLFKQYLNHHNTIPVEILNYACFDDLFCHHLPMQFYLRCVYTKYLMRNYYLQYLLPRSNQSIDTINELVSLRVSSYLEKCINEVLEFYVCKNLQLNRYNEHDKQCVYHSLFFQCQHFIDGHSYFKFQELHSFKILSDALSLYPLFLDCILPSFDEFISIEIHSCYVDWDEQAMWSQLIRNSETYQFDYKYNSRSKQYKAYEHCWSFLDSDSDLYYKINWNESPYREIMRLRVLYHVFNNQAKCNHNQKCAEIMQTKDEISLIEYIYNKLTQYIIENRKNYLQTNDGISCLYDYIDIILNDIESNCDDHYCEFGIGILITSYVIGDFINKT
eukprot:255760_1